MTDLTTYQPQPIEYLSPALADPTGGRLVAWAEGLTAAHRIGAALCQTAFVPVHFKNKPEEAAAAILYGDEIGLTPTQALQNLYVISGKPALYARAMVALVLAAGHEVWTVSKSDAQVTVAGRRRGSSHTIEETWTTARASKAGYTNNKKYQSDPQAMLYARAASDVCRQVAPDALAGLAYSVEESELEEQPPAPVPTRPERATPAKRTTPVVPEPEVVLGTLERDDPRSDDGAVSHGRAPLGEGNGSGSSPDDTPAPSSADSVGEAAAEGVSPTAPHPDAASAFRGLQAQLSERAKAEDPPWSRADVIGWVGLQVGRPIASTKELSSSEVGDVRAILRGARREVTA